MAPVPCQNMQAVLIGPGRVELRAPTVEVLAHDEVRVRVLQCGLCAGEVDQWRGLTASFPSHIGHEVAGEISELGSEVTTLSKGDRVVAWVPGGGFASHVTAKLSHVFRAPRTLRYPCAIEPLACAVNAVLLAKHDVGERVLIVGGGYMGLLIERVLRLRGAEVTVLTNRPASVRMKVDKALVVQHLPKDEEFDVVYETGGSQRSLDTALNHCRMESKLVIVGFHQGGFRKLDLGRLNYLALDIKNAHFRKMDLILRGFAMALRLVEAGMVEADDLVSHEFELLEIESMLRIASDRPAEYIKAVVWIDR